LHEEIERGRKLNTVTSGVVRSAVGGLVLTELVFGVALVGLYVGGYLLLSNLFTWQGDEFLYILLTPFRMAPVEMGILMWFLGAIVIVVIYVYRLARYFQDVTDACAALVAEGDAMITLPGPLHQMEDQLNWLKRESVRNARAAKDAEQRKNDLIVYLAHDLKTPLTSVIGYLSLLRDEGEISPELREKYLAISLDKAMRLEELINEFFDITRFSLTHLTLEPERVSLTRMLEQVAFEFEPLLAEKSLTWELHLPPELDIVCDPDKLERVFDNLIRNAVSYSYPNSTLSIWAEQSDDLVLLRFQNRGKTIPAEKLGRIFEQFFRLDSARGSATGGAGLGLAIAKEIVALHGGSITVASADESVCFTVLLPLDCQKNV
jgi:two-component system sensor histidine kinase VanS